MADEPQVSDEQVEATKRDEERKAFAKKQQAVASEHPNPLVESRTVRNPLVPQPEPDADPLQPLISRPSRGRNSENNIDDFDVAETRTGSAEQAPTQIDDPGDPAPQPGPEVVEPDPAERDELGRVKSEDEMKAEQKDDRAEHRKRVAAGKKAAETRKKNERKK